MSLHVFLDSDVVISSILSEKGVASAIINEKDIKFFISNISTIELDRVCKELNIASSKLHIVKNKFSQINLKNSIKEIKDEFGKYVNGENDSHILAGAVVAKARFLITYNIKDYKTDKILDKFNILVVAPGQFLQYLRSLV